MCNSSSAVSRTAVNEGWKLPFDVVSDIMNISQPSTISKLMKTCRTLYGEGPKHLLCDGVQLDKPADIVKFAVFMLTGDPSRFAHLRKLVWNILLFANLSWTHQARLVNVLGHPSLALETLILHHTDAFLRRSGSCEAIRALKTIKRLVVHGVQADSAKIIQDMSSPLESISICVSPGVSSLLDISSTLNPFSSTLHTLLINSNSYPSVRVHYLFQNLRSHEFPRVQTFGIVWDDSVPELLASTTFASAFPAIKHLQLIPTETPAEMLIEPIASVFGELQTLARNRVMVGGHAQRSRDRGTSLVRGLSLPALDECSGGLLSVYTLGLDRTLTTLRLWQPIRANDLIALRVVLEMTRPRHLRLTTAVSNVPSLFGALRALSTQAPTRIDLYISGSWSHGAVDSFSKILALNRVSSVLEPLFTWPPPSGLVELTLLFDIPEPLRHYDTSLLGSVRVEEAFMRWASTATPPLTLAWRFSVNEDEWRWPDIGQICLDDGDDYDYDYDYDYEDDADEWDWDMYPDSDEDHAFSEVDGDEYTLDQDFSMEWDGDD